MREGEGGKGFRVRSNVSLIAGELGILLGQK